MKRIDKHGTASSLLYSLNLVTEAPFRLCQTIIFFDGTQMTGPPRISQISRIQT